MISTMEKGKRILAIEDEIDILEILEYILIDSGYDVLASQTGDNIFEKVEEFEPDLILLDIMIFNRDGREICKALKADERTKDIPVIMVSAHPDVVNTIEKVGANDFVSKPFDINKLLQKIEHQLGDESMSTFFSAVVQKD